MHGTKYPPSLSSSAMADWRASSSVIYYHQQLLKVFSRGKGAHFLDGLSHSAWNHKTKLDDISYPFRLFFFLSLFALTVVKYI